MQTGEIEIGVNGVMRAVPGRMNLVELVEFLGIAGDRVAIELDGVIVRKLDWTATPIADGSKLEIVQFVGGG